VWRALRTLSPRRRAVLVLHELEGLGIADIAKMLGISAVTVRWHLSVGRRELARVIRQEQGHE
jgi:RNA polymerase sigma-70 factor (ECF subfamily)